MSSGTPSYTTNVGLPAVPDSSDPQLFSAFNQVYNAIRVLQGALDSYTGFGAGSDPSTWPDITPFQSILLSNLDRYYCPCIDTITTGQLVHFFNIGSNKSGARLANGIDATRPCMAYSTGNYNTGDTGEFVLLGLHPFVSGLVPGQLYYLAPVFGGITSIKPGGPGTSGHLIQPVGFALTDVTMYFNPSINNVVV